MRLKIIAFLFKMRKLCTRIFNEGGLINTYQKELP